MPPKDYNSNNDLNEPSDLFKKLLNFIRIQNAWIATELKQEPFTTINSINLTIVIGNN